MRGKDDGIEVEVGKIIIFGRSILDIKPLLPPPPPPLTILSTQKSSWRCGGKLIFEFLPMHLLASNHILTPN